MYIYQSRHQETFKNYTGLHIKNYAILVLKFKINKKVYIY